MRSTSQNLKHLREGMVRSGARKTIHGGSRIAATNTVGPEGAVVTSNVGPSSSAMAAATSPELVPTTIVVPRVVAQTRARVFRGDTHYPNKLLSLFEPHGGHA
jgi:hypothetical protein